MDAEHRYKIGDVAIPSVTQVIADVLPGWQADPWYMERGAALHRACELFDSGTLDWSTVAPEIEPRLVAWKKFRQECPAEMIACEMRLHHPVYHYAGTLDRAFQNRGVLIGDIKSSLSAQILPQLGGYSAMWEKRFGTRVVGGVGIELRDNATYKCQWFDKKEIENGGRIFLAALTIYSFKKKEQL